MAITMLMIMGAGAIAVDGGMMWKERRDLVADVDSAALYGAEVAAENVCNTGGGWTTLIDTHPVYQAALEMLEDNQGSTPDATDFTVEQSCFDLERGKVRVTFNGELTPFFASVYGFDELNVANQATVQFKPHQNGLRPLSMCVDDGSAANDIVNELWLKSPKGTKLTTSLGKTWKSTDFGLANGCGSGGSGSWGWVCFDKNAPDNQCNAEALDDLMLKGWRHDIELGQKPPNTPPPYTGSAANSIPLNGWSDYDCKIRSSPYAGGANDPCDARTSDQNNSKLQAAFNKINCDLDEFGQLRTTPLHRDDCEYSFPILGIWELAGSGQNAVLKPSTFIVVTVRHPTYIVKPKQSDPGGKTACSNIANHPTSATWLNDPPTWDGSEACITFELVNQYWYGSLKDHDFIGTDTRLCGIAGEAGDRCDW
ncbi:MAG: Tad domain-containing protein [Nitriliruptorales bacterium]|nr:Tad domain-containing protein [Nitriliruptorales bacterium]